jgi:hypothetical protein
MNTKKFVRLDGEGKSWGIVSVEQLWANVYALKYNRPEQRLSREIWKSLFERFYSLDGGTLSKSQKNHKLSRRSL